MCNKDPIDREESMYSGCNEHLDRRASADARRYMESTIIAFLVAVVPLHVQNFWLCDE